MGISLPAPLLLALTNDPAFDEQSFRATHAAEKSVHSIRINPFKRANRYAAEEHIPWCPDGRYLPERPAYIADPLFHAGCYYVQEASSMFLEQAVKQTCDLTANLRVLDLCGAPGGKSTHLLSLLSANSLLVANEVIRARAQTLSDNITKWGTLNSVVVNNDPADLGRLKDYFDLIVIDAPCSGSGMFRKDPNTIREWSEDAVALCSQRQMRILAAVMPALKKGGTLIYSTCSYSKAENEDVADWLVADMEMENHGLQTDASWGIEETTSDKGCRSYRFYPHKVKGEGFFLSCFRKKDDGRPNQPAWNRTSSNDKPVRSILSPYLSNPDELKFIPLGDQHLAIRRSHENDLAYLQHHLYLKKAGIRLGKVIGKELLPDHELAMSVDLNPAVSRIELEYDTALRYLRKDELQSIPAGKGWTLVRHRGFSLGWAKLLPNRINNYYPKELRILKQL